MTEQTQTPTPTITQKEYDNMIRSINVQKVINDSGTKIVEVQMKEAAEARAEKEPLPGAYGDFFNNTDLKVTLSFGEVTIRPMVAYDVNVFKLINSPFYRLMMGDEVSSGDQNSLFAGEEEAYELIYQFTHDPKEIYRLFKKGKDIFHDQVMEDIAFKYNPSDAAIMVKEIMNHIFKVNMAKVQFDVSQPEESDKKKQ